MGQSRDEQASRRECEVKIRLESARVCVEGLLEAGASPLEGPMLEDDRLHDDEDSSLSSRDMVVRLRRKTTLVEGMPPLPSLLTYKGPGRVEGGVRIREELESKIEDADAMELILARLGLLPTFRYQKRRQLFEWKETLLAVDETPLGDFLEIEAEPEAIAHVAALLGYCQDDYLSASYPALWRAEHPTGDMLLEEPT